MEEIKLNIIGLSYSQSQSGAYALILGEEKGNRRLPVIIGTAEAQAIMTEIELISTQRPMTHDLFKSAFDTFDIQIEKIIIYNLVEGIFYAYLVCNHKNKTVQIDARTSDAVALALRFGCPIYTYESILTAAGVVIESDDFAFLDNLEADLQREKTEKESSTTKNVKKETSSYSNTPTRQLKQSLQDAIEAEHYELAAKLRDELNRRNE